MDNIIEIKILALLNNVSVVRLAISSFISNLEITVDEMLDIKTAVSEAVTNAIEHGYNNDSFSKNYVIVKAMLDKQNDKVTITVEDKGVGIEDVTLAMTPEYTTKPEDEHAGMGFTIMESFMDEIIVDSKKENGTKITLTKTLKKKHS